MDLQNVQPLTLAGSVMLLNHGPTVLISARDDRGDNVMPAAWVSPLKYDPPMLTAAIFPIHATHHMIRSSGEFVVQIPTAEQLNMVYTIGSISRDDHPDKLKIAQAEIFEIEGYDLPFVADCAAWFACRVSEKDSMIDEHSLFVADVVGAWSNTTYFKNRRWQFGVPGLESSTLHHTGGGNFFTLAGASQARIEISQDYRA